MYAPQWQAIALLAIVALELSGTQASEPSIAYRPVCPTVAYDYRVKKYKLSLPVAMAGRPDNVTLSRVNILASDFPKDAGVTFEFQVWDSENANVLVMCDTFERYRQLNTALLSSPQSLQYALKFIGIIASGIADDKPVKFGPIESSNAPSLSCPVGHWVVFQRRVDGSLSFMQNWDTYVKGFGAPSANYWMGLEQLFANTATQAWTRQQYHYPHAETRCRLRIDTQDFAGNWHTAQWLHFQVLEAKHNYEISVALPLNNASQLNGFSKHHGAQFSTYDRDNDAALDESCSQQNGFSGWWFTDSPDCHRGCLNGPIPTGVEDASTLTLGAFIGGVERWIPMRKSVMMYNCGPGASY